jgi:hypothetical protein
MAATVNISTASVFNGDQNGDTACELRNGGGFIDGATDRERSRPAAFRRFRCR